MFMALVGAGGGAASSAALPFLEELPGNTVVVVSNVPVSRGRITKAEFQHALVLSAVQAGRRSVPRPGENGYERLKGNAIRNLLESAWILGEAMEMGITVTRGEVAREVSLVKRQNFKSEAEYLKFLREGRYTKHDVHERVELQMLIARLQGRLQARFEREGRKEKQAFEEFVTEFNERWRARTVCAPAYATIHCSNGPPST
jgi:parvulin-like peptidyl-prolyl isomerase